jgi:microcin C transport system permease protein
MTNYIVRRLLLMIPTMLGIVTICFLLCQFLPGGPVEQQIAMIRRANANHGASQKVISPEEIANIKAYYGFDQPITVRYIRWLDNLAHFDLGTSYAYRRPVSAVIAERLPITLFFALTATFLSYIISIPLGVWKAVRNGSAFDITTSGVVFAGYVIPPYALGILLIIFLGGGSYLAIFPISGVVSDEYESLSAMGKLLDFLHHICLPMFCYIIGEFAFLTQLMRNTMLDELHKEHVRTALAKGNSFDRAVWKHAFRNSLIPLATSSADLLPALIAGALLLERVFDIDGMGLLFFNSIVSRDYYVVMGIIVLTSILTLIGRLFADLLYVIFDPRIRLT